MPSTLALDFSEYVRITNDGDTVIRGRYDGRDYEWKPHEHLDVHKVVAVHIFGFVTPEMTAALPDERIADIKQRAMMRLGWLRVGEDFENAKKRLADIRITPVPLPDNIRVLRSEDPHRMPQVEGLVPGVAGGSEPRTTSPEAQAPGDVPSLRREDEFTGVVPDLSAPEPDVSALMGTPVSRKNPRTRG